ncbi:MAG: hypothetical protein IK151_10040 [Erysipelotrichaceae bacterium]|nr:hypothetical protein [Erysipelotrichaceae bacterium]
MKKNEILACLKANKKISGYEVSIVNKDSRELFYVLDHLEINRAVKIENTAITVYVSDKKTTGSSTITLTAADDKDSLNKKLNSAISKAKTAKNEYYPLAPKTENIKEKIEIKKDLNEIASNVAKAVFKADTYKNGWINSTEIFVSRFNEEFINSNGIDHVSEHFKVEVECIPTWSNKKEEFELYKFHESNKADYNQITKEIDEILKMAKDRSQAVTLKDVKLPKDLKVLVKGEMVEDIVYNLAENLSYKNTYIKQNHYQINDKVSDNPFDLTMKAVVSGCSASRRYDSNGVLLKPVKLIKGGVAKNTYGDIRFGYYLKEKKISGNLPVCELKADGVDIGKEKHLLVEAFSSPQMEEDSGYWGGEIRLAKYFDGKKYIPLTGLSISGNIYEDIKKVEFSKETTASKYYKGPKYMIFKGIEIS